MIRHINDPEHPNTLEELDVIRVDYLNVNKETKEVKVDFKPTIPNCGMASLIGLSIREKLFRSLPQEFKIDVFIKKGTHE